MRLVAVMLSILLAAVPVSAGTPLNAFESNLDQIAPVGQGGHDTDAIEQAPPCLCTSSGVFGFLSIAKEGANPVAFHGVCVLRRFDVSTGQFAGDPVLCPDFQVLLK